MIWFNYIYRKNLFFYFFIYKHFVKIFRNFITPLLADFVKFIIDEYEKYDDKVNFCNYFVSKLEMDTILDQSEVLGLNNDNFVRDSLRNILKESKIDHQKEVFKETNWKNAHIYCKIHRLTSQQFGPILQNFIIHMYGFVKKSAKLREGDCTKNNLNIEVKVSLGSKNYQIRKIAEIADCDLGLF